METAIHPDYLWDFIVENDLTHVLYEAILHIKDIFGKDTKISLEIDTFNLEYIKLYLWIHSSLSAEESMKLQDRLDAWWIPNLHRGNGKLNIAIRYV
ncbi:MAG TPA: hypothetical protein PLP33_14685 [Leptospiraceae bacterium]|nr:hypothetical protein [Leptospiraceae bacterium]